MSFEFAPRPARLGFQHSGFTFLAFRIPKPEGEGEAWSTAARGALRPGGVAIYPAFVGIEVAARRFAAAAEDHGIAVAEGGSLV